MGATTGGNIVIVIGTVIILGQEIQNVYAFQVRAPAGSITAPQALAEARRRVSALYATLSPYLWNGINFYRISAVNKTTGEDLGETSFDVSGFSALSTGDPLPTGVAGLITLPTNSPRIRGRKFIGGITENMTSGGYFGTGVVSALASVGASLVNPEPFTPAAGSAALDYVVLTQGVGAFTTRRPTSMVASAIPAYQRRRKIGVGS